MDEGGLLVADDRGQPFEAGDEEVGEDEGGGEAGPHADADPVDFSRFVGDEFLFGQADSRRGVLGSRNEILDAPV